MLLLKNENNDDILHQKVESTVSMQRPYIKKILRELSTINSENASLICNYIIEEQTQFDIKESTKEGKIKVLVWLSSFFKHSKSFKQMRKEDILSYLNSLRKDVSVDPNRRWIGSYNGRQLVYNSFFRWLYDGQEHDPRKRVTPSCMTGIRRLPRREKTHYRPSDLFSFQERRPSPCLFWTFLRDL